MSAKVLELENLHVGDEKTIAIATNVASGDNAGSPKNPTIDSSFLCYDPDREVSGEADSGSASSLVDGGRAEADDFWKGMTIVVTDATDGREYCTEVTAFSQATHTLTFNALPIAVEQGDTYRLEGYPLLPETAATVSGNEAGIQLTPGNATGLPGRRVLVYRADFGTDAEEVICRFRVLPSSADPV
jgi:hypothetical protein